MRKYIIITAAAVCAMFAIVFTAAKPVSDAAAAYAYLRELGWKTPDIPEESAVVTVSNDEVNKSYIKMQKEYGFDLEKYVGKEVKRYTFRIKNYPYNGNVYANILMYKGKIIGGDIMTRELNGFMKGLHKKDGTN